VLATLAIIVWHFYQVFFDPDVYPMNWAWWDGKMTLHHYQDEHGLDTTVIAASVVAPIPGEAAAEDEPAVTGVEHGQ